MYRYASLLAPLIFKQRRDAPKKNILVTFLAWLAIILGSTILLGTLYAWMWSLLGALMASLIVGAGLLVIGGAALVTVNKLHVSESEPQVALDSDPIGRHIPDAIKLDPTVTNAVNAVQSNPVIAMSTAMAAGAWLAHELLGK